MKIFFPAIASDLNKTPRLQQQENRTKTARGYKIAPPHQIPIKINLEIQAT
jgi:hypothetical protein